MRSILAMDRLPCRVATAILSDAMNQAHDLPAHRLVAPIVRDFADRILVMRDFSLVGEIENSRRYEPMSRQIMSLIHGVAEDGGRDAARQAVHV